jgi:hypothetical protein
MILTTNNPPGTTKTIVDIKKLLINEFQNPSSEDQYMNEMIEIRQKLGESVWEIDQIFKRTQRKNEISHDRYATQAPVCQLTVTTLEISTVTTRVSDTGRGSAGIHATGGKPISEDLSNHRRDEGGYE